MSNPSKAKGSLFERLVVEYLQANGFPFTERRVQRGSKDAGDVSWVREWTLELKATRELDVAGALDEARAEAKNAGSSYFAAVLKRRRKSIAEAYVVMPLAQFAAIVRHLG